jgi:hypothetical protein
MAGVGFSDGDKGDITISSSGTVLTIDNDAVTYAKIQNVSATDRLLGRSSAGAGDVEELDAATARTVIGVQPTASPAFTGAATFANTGNVVPLTVTNTGTANSFVVNDASGDTTPFVIDASGQVGIGTSAPQRKLHIANDGAEGLEFFVGIFSGESRINAFNRSSSSWNKFSIGCSTLEFFVGSGGTSALAISSTGTATFAGQIVGQAGAAFTGAASATWNSTDGVQISRATTAGIAIGSTNTPSNTNSFAGWSAYASDGTANVAGGTINFRANENWSSTNHGTDIQFRATPAGSGGALTEVLRITGGGQTLVTAGSGSSGSYKPGVAISGDDDTGIHQVSGNANTLSIVTNGTERVRVDASGNVGIGATPSTWGGNVTNVLELKNGVSVASNSAVAAGYLHTNLVSADGGATYTYKTTQFGHLYLQYNGEHVFYTAPSGTAGNTATITARLTISSDNGKITAAGVYNNTVGGTNRDVFVDSGGLIGYVSSIRESKTDIVTLDDVSWLSALSPVSYRYRKKNADGTYSAEADGVTDYGLIAEDVEAVKPELCFYDDVDGEPQLRGVTYSKLITPMLKYIQQLEARIAALEERING